jgi:hypothetical protein
VSVTKRCGRCEQVKPETEFNRLRAGRQHWCRECFREYFRARGDLHRRQSLAARRKRQSALRAHLDAHLAAHACADCGEADSRVLDFDHVGKKTSDISELWRAGAPLEALVAEMANCEVVCANCHRLRTAIRAGWWRLRSTLPAAGPRWRRIRNVRWIYERLREAACVDCGIRELVLLEFDHVGEKRSTVMDLAWSEYSLETLEREIEECEVRCCNCHRKRTAERRANAA